MFNTLQQIKILNEKIDNNRIHMDDKFKYMECKLDNMECKLDNHFDNTNKKLDKILEILQE